MVGEIEGLGSQLELQLGYWGTKVYMKPIIARDIWKHLGLEYRVDDDKVQNELEKRIRRKELRNEPARRTLAGVRRGQARSSKGRKREDTYVGGGTQDAVNAATSQMEVEGPSVSVTAGASEVLAGAAEES